MNLTESNLIPLTTAPNPGQRVIQIAPNVWLPVGLQGSFSNSSSAVAELQAGVLVDDNGVLKVQPLHFEGTQAHFSDSLQQGQLKIFNTSMSEPAYGGSSGSMDFYKCSYVDTANNTWTGYKAVQDPVTGVYSFESDSTGGLTYISTVPVVNSVYSSDTLVKVSYLYDGGVPGILARYPLVSDALDITGRGGDGTIVGSLTFDYLGAHGFSSMNYIHIPNLLVGIPFTICMWLYQTQATSMVWRILLRVYNTNCFYSFSGENDLGLTMDSTDARSTYTGFKSSPVHVAVTWDPQTGTTQDYQNGVKIGTHTGINKSWKYGTLALGGNDTDSGNYYADKMCIRDVVFVDHVLSQAQIATIMNQEL